MTGSRLCTSTNHRKMINGCPNMPEMQRAKCVTTGNQLRYSKNQCRGINGCPMSIYIGLWDEREDGEEDCGKNFAVDGRFGDFDVLVFRWIKVYNWDKKGQEGGKELEQEGEG